MNNFVTIEKEGRLRNSKIEWQSGHEVLRNFDVTDIAPEFVFDPCFVDPEVTLRDVMLLAKRHSLVFSAVIGRGFLKTLEDSFSNTSADPDPDDDPLIRIRLHWDGVASSAFQDRLLEDLLSQETTIDGVSQSLQHFGLGIEPPSSLMDVPFVIDANVNLSEEDSEESQRNVRSLVVRPSFGRVLCGVFDELSFDERHPA